MKRTVVLLIAGIIITGVVIARAKNEISVENMPPVVVKTLPRAGDMAVDPFLKRFALHSAKKC